MRHSHEYVRLHYKFYQLAVVSTLLPAPCSSFVRLKIQKSIFVAQQRGAEKIFTFSRRKVGVKLNYTVAQRSPPHFLAES